MSKFDDIENVKRIYKEKCPRCMGEIVFFGSNQNTSDYIVLCLSSACGFCIIKEGQFSYFSSG